MEIQIKKAEEKAGPLFFLPGSSREAAKQRLGSSFPQVRYLEDFVGFPVYEDTETHYYSPEEKMLEALIPELERAERYIFLEFFIVQDGIMWGRILNVLRQKAAHGVKVRLLYDDIGCFLLLPTNYVKQLEAFGIECSVFNPFRPVLTVAQNNRNHRKIISIDGKVAFTGGINLADEYRDGFMHSKTFVSDNRIATVGTTNPDFRNLNLLCRFCFLPFVHSFSILRATRVASFLSSATYKKLYVNDLSNT